MHENNRLKGNKLCSGIEIQESLRKYKILVGGNANLLTEYLNLSMATNGVKVAIFSSQSHSETKIVY